MAHVFDHKISLGQNFLNNPLVIRRSAEAGDLNERDVVLEIGSGQGALTREILKSPARFVHTMEIDARLEPWLTPLESEFPGRVKIHWGDAQRCSLAELSPTPNKVLANIPYNITTPLIRKVLAELAPLGLERLILLVQKEAAERLAAPPGSKNRYPLGVTIELMGEIGMIMKVSPGSFTPPPKVWSSLIGIHITGRRTLASDELWRRLVTGAFSQRRKKLVNTLSAAGYPKDEVAALLSALSIPPSIRAEELTAAQWLYLYEAVRGS